MIHQQSPTGPKVPVLEAKNMTISFQSGGFWVPVVRDLNLSVTAGETLAIVGESGSGKSVTSLAIMRLLDPRSSRISGEVHLKGRDLLNLPEAEMRSIRGGQVSMIFQEPMTSLNPVMTVGQQICEALKLHTDLSSSEIRREAISLLDRVHIPQAATCFKEHPHRLSGGMRQRVMIAMALAAKPALLIADEPTTALDVTIQGEILSLIKELQAESGTAVLFITHDMAVVSEVADRTLVMWKGDVIEEGVTRDILTRPVRPYTKALLAAIPRIGSMAGTSVPHTFPVVDPLTGESEPQKPMAPAKFDHPVLDVSSLCKTYGKARRFFGKSQRVVPAVDNVSLQVFPGETLSLVGESGSGKSTTGRTIMRLVEPDSGAITISGTRFDTLPLGELRRQRRHVQMIFQDPFASLNPRRKIHHSLCEAYVEHGMGNLSQAREKAEGLMEAVGLRADMLDRFPHAFSGGQRQRVSIARALMLDPKLIVADESVSALDVIVKAQVCNLLMNLQAKLGLAYLFISHDMSVVERVSHRVAVMRQGQIVEIGPRDAVFANPQHTYTRKLIASVPSLDPVSRKKKQYSGEPLSNTTASLTYRQVCPGHLVAAEERWLQKSEQPG